MTDDIHETADLEENLNPRHSYLCISPESFLIRGKNKFMPGEGKKTCLSLADEN